MRYLNPKADLTFKKVFGEHPDLVASFLNALLPFDSPEEESSTWSTCLPNWFRKRLYARTALWMYAAKTSEDGSSS